VCPENILRRGRGSSQFRTINHPSISLFTAKPNMGCRVHVDLPNPTPMQECREAKLMTAQWNAIIEIESSKIRDYSTNSSALRLRVAFTVLERPTRGRVCLVSMSSLGIRQIPPQSRDRGHKKILPTPESHQLRFASWQSHRDCVLPLRDLCLHL